MKFAVRGRGNFKTYADVMNQFSRRFFNSDDYVGKLFLHWIGSELEDADAPCDKIVLDIFTGSSDRFDIIFWFKKVKIGYLSIEVSGDGMMRLYNHYYYAKEFNGAIHKILEKFLDERNSDIIQKNMAECGLTPFGSDNKVTIIHFRNFIKEYEVEWTGRLEDIWDRFTTLDDTLKYCNDEYVDFADERVRALYRMFAFTYKGSYSLDNAVKRGVIID